MRKSIEIAVAAENRDKGKRFRITEMAAPAAEEWGMRALTILGRSGVELPAEAIGGNMLAIAAFGLQAIIQADFDAAKPLLAEMMGCVKLLQTTEGGSTTERPLYPDDVEEVSTLSWLRDNVLELHTGFSVAAYLSKLRAQVEAARTLSPRATRTSRK